MFVYIMYMMTCSVYPELEIDNEKEERWTAWRSVIGVYQGLEQVAVSKLHSVNPPQGHLCLWPEQSRLCGLTTTGWQRAGDITTLFDTWRGGGRENNFLSLLAACLVDPLWRTRFEVFLCAAICWLEAAVQRVWNWMWATSVCINIFMDETSISSAMAVASCEQRVATVFDMIPFLHVAAPSPNRALNLLQRHLLF